MPRIIDDGGDDDDTRGTATKASVQSVGHSQSGGHSATTKAPMRSIPRNQIVKNFFENRSDGQDMPYVYEEFPKHVTVAGRLYTATSAEHEAEILALGRTKNEATDRTRMIALADEKGVSIDKRWGLDRIAQVLRDNGHDPDIK